MIGAAIGAGVSALGTLFSGLSARKQAQKAEKQLLQRKDALNKEYAHDKNTNYLDTESARSTLALLRRQNQRQQEALNNNAVKSGASDEAKVAAAGRLNDSYADAVSQIAGMGTEYKQRLKENYQNRADSLDDALLNVQMGKAQATNEMIGQFAQTAGGFLSAYGLEGTNGAKAAARQAKKAEPAYVSKSLANTVGKVAPPMPTLNVPALSTAGIGMKDLTRRTQI
ncbi:MAG: hypothetical protein K2G93_03125 [Rikenella sp.]|nr:hypothetical protein [Rikenella sp.]